MLEELYASYRKHGAKVRKIQDSIAKQQARLQKLENKSGWYQQVLVPLAERLSKELNMPYEIYGPFGLGSEVSIYFFANGVKGNICEEDVYGITLHPASRHCEDWKVPYEDRFYLTYNTGEKRNYYAEGTIGWLNGFSNVEAELPDSVEEIIKIVKSHFIAGNKEE